MTGRRTTGPGSSDRAEVLVVGGGLIGLCCAYYAQRRGFDVCMLERTRLGSGASIGNAGLVPISATVPLAGPGVIRRSAKWLLDPDGALRIRPRASWSLARWFLEFRRQCTSARAAEVNSLLVPLLRRSIGALEDLLASEEIDCEFFRTGTLAICANEMELAELIDHDLLLAAAGVECQRVDREEARTFEPDLLGIAIAGGTHYPEDGHLDPSLLIAGIAERLRAGGVRIRTGTSVSRLVAERGRVVGVETREGVIGAGEVVVAAGIDTPGLVAPLGVDLLVQPAKGYHLEFADLRRPRLPLRLVGAKTIVTPLKRAVRITSKLELTPRPGISRRRVLEGVPRLASAYLDFAGSLHPTSSWAGFRPLTPDGLPCLGRVDAVENLVLATGHGQLGLALAPVTGLLVAELLSGETPSLLVDHLGPERWRSGVELGA